MWGFWQQVVSHLAAFSQPGLLSALKPGHLRAGSPEGLGWGSLLSPSGALRQVRGLWGSWGQPWAGGLSILGSPAPAPAPTTRPTDFGSAGTKPGCWTLRGVSSPGRLTTSTADPHPEPPAALAWGSTSPARVSPRWVCLEPSRASSALGTKLLPTSGPCLTPSTAAGGLGP